MWIGFLLTAGNESCPQPQTSEHLAAIEIMRLKHILILQNKIDLVKDSQAKDQYDQILKFVQGLFALNELNDVLNVIILWFRLELSPLNSIRNLWLIVV